MKIIIKSRLFAFILGALIFSGITGVAAYNMFAKDIKYTPSDTTWKKSNGEDITNVEEAIDELYNKKNTNGPIRSNNEIPEGITKVKAIVVRCTDSVNYLNLNITGDIVKSYNIVHLNDKLQSGAYHVYVDEITIDTSGMSGSISISGSGGSGNRVLYYYLYY